MTDDGGRGAGLRWTGQPLIDVGVAALTEFSGRSDPSEVTLGDLDEFVNYAERSYLSANLRKSVGLLFPNGPLNVSFTDERKGQEIRAAAGAFHKEPNPALTPCTFCGRPAAAVLHRDSLPMILGRSTVNFYPGGAPGLTICGLCQTALHGLTLGAPRCSGKALVLYADDPAFLLELVRGFVQRTRREVQLEAQGETLAGFSAPRTRVIEALLRVQREAGFEDRGVGVVAYHISNSGQGPGIVIYPLPSAIIHFLQRARHGRYYQDWTAIERRAWQHVSKKGQSAAELAEDERGEYRNYLYEDLFRLPEEAGRFIRLYFLRDPGGLVRRTDLDPRTDYSTATELEIISWNLVALFLQEVVGMEQSRIDAIRALGDQLAEEVIENNDRRLLRTAYTARNFATVRRLLLQTNLRRLDRDSEPLVGFADFLEVFELGEELARVDWLLAWDLVRIRLIEQLYQLGKVGLVKDAVSPDEVAEGEEDSAERMSEAMR